MDSFEDMMKQYEQRLFEFYLSFFSDADKTHAFLDHIYQYDRDDRIPRQMVNQVYRFTTLATRINEIWPPRDGLRLLFIKTCMDSLCYLSGYTEKKKTETFYKKFGESFSESGKQYILSNFHLTSYPAKVGDLQFDAECDLTIDDFLRIIKAVRDKVVHDGNYWEFQMFATDDDSTWTSTLTTNEDILKNYPSPKAEKSIEYHFDTTLQYEQFKFYFVEACINFIKGYIKRCTF